MDENFYFFVLAIPATCAFWFLYAIIVTELANWLTSRRLRNNKSRQKKPKAKTIRGFDYPELFYEDNLQRIRELEKRITACDQEIEKLRNKELVTHYAGVFCRGYYVKQWATSPVGISYPLG
jgi:hypothetical protein